MKGGEGEGTGEGKGNGEDKSEKVNSAEKINENNENDNDNKSDGEHTHTSRTTTTDVINNNGNPNAPSSTPPPKINLKHVYKQGYLVGPLKAVSRAIGVVYKLLVSLSMSFFSHLCFIFLTRCIIFSYSGSLSLPSSLFLLLSSPYPLCLQLCPKEEWEGDRRANHAPR